MLTLWTARIGSSTIFPEEKTQIIYLVIQQTFPPAVKGMVHLMGTKLGQNTQDTAERMAFCTQFLKTSKNQQKAWLWDFFFPCRTLWSFSVKCAFPVRIKIDFVFLAAAYSSECGKVTMQNPRNHQHLCTGDKSVHEKGGKELFRLFRQSVPHIKALSLVCVGFVCVTEWG